MHVNSNVMKVFIRLQDRLGQYDMFIIANHKLGWLISNYLYEAKRGFCPVSICISSFSFDRPLLGDEMKDASRVDIRSRHYRVE